MRQLRLPFGRGVLAAVEDDCGKAYGGGGR